METINLKVGYISTEKKADKTLSQRVAQKVLKFRTRQAYSFESGGYITLRDWYLFGSFILTTESKSEQLNFS
ncbi:MAG: hypothetical protein LBB41_06680 [Prevotellaceae bacterium]|jgi:hypothetical protein|nr:hypothetical protein [Prevotellaceae bacterium]